MSTSRFYRLSHGAIEGGDLSAINALPPIIGSPVPYLLHCRERVASRSCGKSYLR